MEWWRCYHGMWRDEKLVLVARRTGAKMCDVIAVTVTVLDHASRNMPRGSLIGYDLELLSEFLEIPTSVSSRIWYELAQVGFIEENHVKNWQKYQASRERCNDNSAERTRRYRARKDAVTPCDDTVTPCDALDKSRLDKRRKEDIDSPSGNSGLRVSTEDVTKAIDNWNTMAERLGLAAVRDRTEQRKKAVAMRLKQFGGLVAWNEALHELADQPFCCGENDRGWKATFDWFLKPASLAKIREGAYRRDQQ